MTTVTLIDVNGRSRKVNLGREVASGAAGAVHLVDGEPSTVIKLYHSKTLYEDGQMYADKIKYMLGSVPALASSPSRVVQIAWPNAAAHDMSGNFVGFAMLAVDFKSSEGLEYLMLPKLARLNLKRSDLGVRITVAANLASIITAIHDKGHQIVDLKPPNLRFYRDGLHVAVLDCDGFHIQTPRGAFKASQVTNDYLAPEFQGKEVKNPEHQDRFALGVVIFKLLNFGVHPYTGNAKNPSAPTDIEGKISQGLYAYAITPHRMIEAHPVSAHHFFPEEFRRFFDRAFGSLVDRRPTPREWTEVLNKYAQPKYSLLKACGNGHLWFVEQQCGECHRESILNPSAAAGLRPLPPIPSPQTAPTPIRGKQPPPPTAKPLPIPTGLSRFIGPALIGIPIILLLIGFLIPKMGGDTVKENPPTKAQVIPQHNVNPHPPTMKSSALVLGMGESQIGFERDGSTGYVYWHGRLLDDSCLSEKRYVLLSSPSNRYVAGFCSLTGKPDISPSRLLDNQNQQIVYSGFGCMFGNGTPQYSWINEDTLGSATCHINVADLMKARVKPVQQVYKDTRFFDEPNRPAVVVPMQEPQPTSLTQPQSPAPNEVPMPSFSP